MPLSNVGLEDFRAFSGATHFKFAPITIITGTNSSGKSSLLDAIRIMHKYFARSVSGVINNRVSWIEASKLLLEDLIPRTPSATELINHASENNQRFEIRFTVNLLNIDDTFYLRLFFYPEKGTQKAAVQIALESISANKTVFELSTNDDRDILNVDFPFFIVAFEGEVNKQIAFYTALEQCYPSAKFTTTSLEDGSTGEIIQTCLDDQLFEELKNIHPGLYEYHSKKQMPWFVPNDPGKWPTIKDCLAFSPIIEFSNREYSSSLGSRELDFYFKDHVDFRQIETLKKIANQLLPYYNYRFTEHPQSDTDTKKLDYLTLITAEGVAESSQDEIMSKLEKKWLQNVVFTRRTDAALPDSNLWNDFLYILRDPVNHLVKDRSIDPKINGVFRLFEKEDEQQYKMFYKLLSFFDTGNSSWYWNDKDDKRGAFSEKGKAFFGAFLYPQFERLYTLLSDTLTHDYVPSIRTFPQRFFGSTKSTFIDEVIAKFLEANPLENGAPEVRSFVQKYLKTFGIGDDVAIAYNDELGIKTIIISREGAKINLLDLGFGILQFVPLLLQIAITAARHVWRHDDAEPYLAITDSVMMLIEEPETNLHPALQSKLADLFVEASREFKIQFVIESHSEYLIRKLQYLTAKGEIEPDKTQIYYCNNPKDLSNGEPQVKKINIQEDGSLTGDFGTGFFDEADKIAMSIWNMTQSQKN